MTARALPMLAVCAVAAAWLAAGATLAVGCGATDGTDHPVQSAGRQAPVGPTESREAWPIVYAVLQHPRCMNCHPTGDAPLQGDASLPHAQNVQRGETGQGLYALRCDACHQSANLAGAHLPPGAPNWHLPRRDEPLVFQGRSAAELCRQLQDPKQNGHKSLEELYAHVTGDPLVLWGWNPGEGRTPIPTPHAEFVAAVRTWIDGGCQCPEP